jgi:hypothetical protein
MRDARSTSCSGAGPRWFCPAFQLRLGGKIDQVGQRALRFLGPRALIWLFKLELRCVFGFAPPPTRSPRPPP